MTKTYMTRVLAFLFIFTNNAGVFAASRQEPTLKNGLSKYFTLSPEIIDVLTERYNTVASNIQDGSPNIQNTDKLLTEILNGADQQKISDLVMPILTNGSLDPKALETQIPQLIQRISQNLPAEQINRLRDPQFAETIKQQLIQTVTKALEDKGFTLNQTSGKYGLTFNGFEIKGMKFSLSADRRFIIIDNFKITRGDTTITSDRVTIDRSQLQNGKVATLDAVNLNVKNKDNNISFGWSQLSAGRDSQSKVSSLKVVSSQINITENGMTKFATKKGPTGLEAIHTSIELLPSNGVKLSLNTEVGFDFNRNPLAPQKDLRVETMGGSLLSAELNLNSQAANVTYKFQNESDLKVFDPIRGQNVVLAGNSEIKAIENRSTTNGQTMTIDYVLETDQILVDSYKKGEKIVIQGASVNMQDNKIGQFTQGNVAIDYASKKNSLKEYQIYNAVYHFKEDATLKTENLKSDKAIYISDKGTIQIAGNIAFQQTTNKKNGENASYLSGDKVTYYKEDKWTSVFYNVEATTTKYADKSEKSYLTAHNGVLNSNDTQVKLNGLTHLVKETTDNKQTTKYSLVNESVLSGEQDKNGHRQLFSLAHADIQSLEAKTSSSKATHFTLKGDDFYFEDQSKGQTITSKNISIISNKTETTDDTTENYAVELGETLLKDLNKGKNDYVLISSTVLYEKSAKAQEQKGSILVKDLTGEVEGYKLSFKINKPEDALQGKTVDIYFNKSKQLEYYSIKNEHGIIAAEKDGKKIVWTGGSIDVYKDGEVKLSNITGTEMMVSDDKFAGHIKIGQASALETATTQSLKAANVSVDGKSNKGELGTISFGDLEILKGSGIQNLSATKFSALLSKLDSKDNQSVAITSDGIEAAQVDGVSRGMTITNGGIIGTDNNKGQNVKLNFSNFAGSENIADKSKGLTIEQAKISFSEQSSAQQLIGDLTIGKVVSFANKEKDTSIIEISDMKLLVVDANKNTSLSGSIGWAKTYRDSEVNYLELKDLNQIKVDDTAKARSLLFNGKRIAHYKNENGTDVVIVEQAQIQATDPKGTLQVDVKALEYFSNNNTDLKVIKEADIKGHVVYDGQKTDFQLNAKNIKFVNNTSTDGQTTVRYFGIEPTADDSHVELKIDHKPITIELKGKSVGVQLITDKSMARYTFIGQSNGGDKFKIKAGPLEINGKNRNGNSQVLLNMTAIGTQHQVLLEQVAGLTNEMPLTKNLSYNKEGFLKFQVWITKSTAIKVSYSGTLPGQESSKFTYNNTASSLILSVVRKMKSETRYGIDFGLLGASAAEMTANDRCAMKLYNQCLGNRMLIPMTAYVGMNRCKVKNGRTVCTDVGATYDLTTSMIQDAAKDAPGRMQGRTAGGANLVLGTSFVTKGGVANTLSITAGELNGFLYKLYVPLK